MVAKINKSVLFSALGISLICTVCWVSGSTLFERMILLFTGNPLNSFNQLILYGLLSFIATSVLVLILLKNQVIRTAGLETRLRDADETLENRVTLRTAELEQKVNEFKILKGIIPICANCKNIRNEAAQWEQIEVYIQRHSEAVFSHGLCPDCNKALYGEQRLHFEAIARKYS